MLQQQICTMLQAGEGVLKINFMTVQRQTNSVDCGIFAMAFLTWILVDEDEGLLQMLVEHKTFSSDFIGAVLQLLGLL